MLINVKYFTNWRLTTTIVRYTTTKKSFGLRKIRDKGSSQKVSFYTLIVTYL